MSGLRKVGEVTHFFTDIDVAVLELSDMLREGDEIHIKGATTDFRQDVNSMQIEHETVEEAGAGDAIGLKVKSRVREGDEVFKVMK
jgi:putative protease